VFGWHRNHLSDNYLGRLCGLCDAYSEAELSAYCREKGLFTEQVKQWRTDCLQGFGRTADSERQVKQERKKTTKEIKKLKAEVRRKD
jgi:hypothetical protein